MRQKMKLIGIACVIAIAVAAVYMKGMYDGSGGKELALTSQAVAAQRKAAMLPRTTSV